MSKSGILIFRLKLNESIFIPKSAKHRLANNNKEDLIVIEVQYGDLLQEEDIINQQKEISLMKNDPDVKSIIEMFPGTKIHTITPITETSDEKNHIKEQQQIKEE